MLEFSGIGMLDLGYCVLKLKIMNGLCVVCSVFHFGCLGGIFGYVLFCWK